MFTCIEFKTTEMYAKLITLEYDPSASLKTECAHLNHEF